MTSIKEVAKLAGVSIATVSRYINNPDQVKANTAAKVKIAIGKTGYAPNTLAQNFRRGKTQQIIVVIPSVGVPFFEGVMRGIWRVAKEQNFNILVMETHYNTLAFDDYSRMIFSKQADGIILLSSLSPFEEPIVDQNGGKHPPIVLSLENVATELSHFPSVRIDNIAAAKDATSYLIDLGHRNIAFIYGRPHENSTLTEYRERGFRQAMSDAGISVNESWVIDGKMSIDGARQAARQMLHYGKRPSAVFCANDEMAMGVLHEIKHAGLKVPQDISVVGFDDIRFAEVSDPPLTTVSQPAEEIGERTMFRLCKAIEQEDIGPGAEIVPHKLVVRKSTAPAK